VVLPVDRRDLDKSFAGELFEVLEDFVAVHPEARGNVVERAGPATNQGKDVLPLAHCARRSRDRGKVADRLCRRVECLRDRRQTLGGHGTRVVLNGRTRHGVQLHAIGPDHRHALAQAGKRRLGRGEGSHDKHLQPQATRVFAAEGDQACEHPVEGDRFVRPVHEAKQRLVAGIERRYDQVRSRQLPPDLPVPEQRAVREHSDRNMRHRLDALDQLIDA